VRQTRPSLSSIVADLCESQLGIQAQRGHTHAYSLANRLIGRSVTMLHIGRAKPNLLIGTFPARVQTPPMHGKRIQI